jgi:hypothetical protein
LERFERLERLERLFSYTLSQVCVFQLLEFCPPLSCRGVIPVRPLFTTSTSGEKNSGKCGKA